MAATTTIKVTPALRERINRHAAERGLTACGFMEQLVGDLEREQMLAAFGHAFAAAGTDYRDETADWDGIQTAWPG
ncbi:MAG: toxin-antitoxin system protein [Actinomycetia bacterium]|nr:toxin-antitoxin system protein [Actinomycetes bacterium]